MITSVKNPVWANESQTLINVIVTTDQTGSAELPFTASKSDQEKIGIQIFYNCINGNYGPIAPYVPPLPPPPPPEPTAEHNKQQAMKLLQATDWVVLSDVDDLALTPHLLNKSEFITYRSQLRQIAVQPEPGNLNWPTKPSEQWRQ